MEENFLSNLLGSFGIFPSKEKLKKREAYQNEMFPFGDEEKRLVTHHLQRVNRTYPVNKTMFLFHQGRISEGGARGTRARPVRRTRACAFLQAACAAAGRASVPFFLRNA